jgi:hypothetical protein
MAATTDTQGIPVGFDGPGTKLLAITPADATDLTTSKIRALWVGGAGNLSLIALNDTSAVTITGVLAGTILPISVVKVMTATTATNIVGIS